MAELANGELIAANAQELARHSDELSDHERRISALETDNNTNKQDIADIKAKNAAQDSAIAAVDDKVEHLELIDPKEYAKTIARIDAKDAAQDGEIKALKAASADHVTKQEFTADQKRQDDIVGNWKTAHPNQTITQCVASMESELTEHAGDIASLQTAKANKTDIPDVSGYATKTYVDTQDAARIPLKTSAYDNAASSIALGVPSHTTDAPNVWSILGLFIYPVFSYKDMPGDTVDTKKGKLHLYKADGTEVPVPNWVTTANLNNAFGVLARLGPDFTPDSPFYVIVYRNNADKYSTAADDPTA